MKRRVSPYNANDMLPGHPYRVLHELGSGGMAIVYCVEDVDLEKEFAAKVGWPEKAERGEYSMKQLLQEAQALVKLSDWTENVTHVFRVGVTTDALRLPFLIMERLRGETLRQIIEKRKTHNKPLRLLYVLCTIRDIALALAIAHKHGIVHRDIKPSNIFLHKKWTQYSDKPVTVVKLNDFGVLAPFNEDMGARGGDDSNKFAGTWRYAAPEQLEGKQANPKSDVYALGLVFFEMLALRGPYDLGPGDTDHVAKCHADPDVLPPAMATFRRVPPAIESLVARMLSKDAGLRPSAFDVAEKLFDAIKDLHGTDAEDEEPGGPRLESEDDTTDIRKPILPIATTRPKAKAGTEDGGAITFDPAEKKEESIVFAQPRPPPARESPRAMPLPRTTLKLFVPPAPAMAQGPAVAPAPSPAVRAEAKPIDVERTDPSPMPAFTDPGPPPQAVDPSWAQPSQSPAFERPALDPAPHAAPSVPVPPVSVPKVAVGEARSATERGSPVAARPTAAELLAGLRARPTAAELLAGLRESPEARRARARQLAANDHAPASAARAGSDDASSLQAVNVRVVPHQNRVEPPDEFSFLPRRHVARVAVAASGFALCVGLLVAGFVLLRGRAEATGARQDAPSAPFDVPATTLLPDRTLRDAAADIDGGDGMEGGAVPSGASSSLPSPPSPVGIAPVGSAKLTTGARTRTSGGISAAPPSPTIQRNDVKRDLGMTNVPAPAPPSSRIYQQMDPPSTTALPSAL